MKRKLEQHNTLKKSYFCQTQVYFGIEEFCSFILNVYIHVWKTVHVAWAVSKWVASFSDYVFFSSPSLLTKVLKLYFLESYPVLNLNEFYSQSSWKNVTYYSLFILIMHAIIWRSLGIPVVKTFVSSSL